MKKILLFSCLLSAAFISCEEVENQEIPSDVNSLNVCLPSLDVRSSLSQSADALDMHWSDGDVISVGMNNLSAALVNVGNNSKEAQFSFKKSINDGSLVRFPAIANQSYVLIPSSYESDGGKCPSEMMPMWGTVSLEDAGNDVPDVTLKSMVAVLKFSVKGNATITKATIDAGSGEYLNGRFNVSRSGALTEPSNPKSRTEIEFKEPLVLNGETPVEIFVPVLCGTYSSGLSFKLYDAKEKLMKVVVFKDGEQLSSKDFAEFNVVYTPNNQIELAPGEPFDPGKLKELPEDELAYEEYEVAGTIRYDDGQPAAGVRVSDGFSVVVTDADGRYDFRVKGTDVRYIYISYPSDSRIEVNRSNDCPAFFQTYSASKHVYNFTLIRQAVEKKFALFAMADPQTHYQKRDSQKKADTDRYGEEAVPSLNQEIAKQNGLSCYGVCLGDITYSEGNRDSTPSMKIIRSHFGRVNMPVFNAMGNHDYTFYKKGVNIAEKVASTPGSSTVNLHAQRSYEEVFGPVNFSFDRGDVHFVCMKDIYFNSTSTWDASSYSGGFTDEEYEWLVQDLAHTPKTMKVVLCVHIPISTSTSGRNVSKVQALLRQYTNSIVFSGHTHYQRTFHQGGKLYEQVHAALCGQWWWSKIEGDGCPAGYTVYHFNGTDIEDSYFIGYNDKMNTRDYQMRIYKGNLTTGGKYAYFKMPYSDNTFLINVFNGDATWKIQVYEDGIYKGQPDLLARTSDSFSSVKAGQTYATTNMSSSMDWWSVGYHIGVCKRGTSSTSYYTGNYHMWKWVASSPSAKIKVVATDPYGNEYTCEDVITDGTNYPDYIKVPLNI